MSQVAAWRRQARQGPLAWLGLCEEACPCWTNIAGQAFTRVSGSASRFCHSRAFPCKDDVPDVVAMAVLPRDEDRACPPVVLKQPSLLLKNASVAWLAVLSG